MRPILFLVSAASSYRLQKYVADHLARQGRSIVFLYEHGEDATYRLISRDAAATGARVYSLQQIVDPLVESRAVWRRHPRRGSGMAIAARVAIVVPGLVRSLAESVLPSRTMGRLQRGMPVEETSRLAALRAALASQLAGSLSLLSTESPGAMVACEDGISAPLAVHAAARHLGVPVVVIPYGYGVRRDLEIALEAKIAQGLMIRADGRWADVIRAHASQWVKQGLHEGALMYREEYILAAESLGITLRDAWTIHGGYADRLCVESRQMRRVYLSEGVPERKLAMTGSPYCDLMVRAVAESPPARAALRQPRRIDPGRTRILVSWPPSYHADRGAHSEFPSYRDLSIAVLGWLATLERVEVTISLHPATLPEDRAALEAAGVRLSDAYVIEEIPRHDIFVTYFSSTIRWAVAAGKPVVNFDLYKLGLQVFASAPGVKTVTSFARFQSTVSELVLSDAAFAAAAGEQIAVADEWGILDGQCMARIGAEIDRLAA